MSQPLSPTTSRLSQTTFRTLQKSTSNAEHTATPEESRFQLPSLPSKKSLTQPSPLTPLTEDYFVKIPHTPTEEKKQFTSEPSKLTPVEKASSAQVMPLPSSKRGAFEALVEREALLIPDHTKVGVKDSLFDRDMKDKNILYGTGLCTTDKVSVGVPFDFLGYLLTAEKIRRQLGMGKIVHFIADAGANTNDFVRKNNDFDANAMALRFKTMLETFAANHGIQQAYQPLLGSEVEKDPAHHALFEQIKSKDSEENRLHDYVYQQMTDMEYLRQKHNVALKLSWLMNPKKEAKFDERFFDKTYTDKVSDSLSFAYTGAGKTFDSKRPGACPYTATAEESRILISPEVGVDDQITAFQKQSNKAAKAAIKHLENLVKSYEELFGPIEGEKTLGQKIEHINAKFFVKTGA